MRAGLGMRALAHAVVGMVLLALAACGGGGGGGGAGGGAGSGNNRPPTAIANVPQTGFLTGLVTFDGSSSSDPDGNSLTYTWSITSAPNGSTAIIQDTRAVRPNFRPDKIGVYRVSLVVHDGSTSSAPSLADLRVDQNTEDSQRAGNSQIEATLEVPAMTSQLRWVDTFPSYRIEVLESDGTFRQVENLAGLGDGAAIVKWRRPFTGPVTYRVIGMREDREVALQANGPVTTFNLIAPATAQIEIDQPEPVFASVTLGLVSQPSQSQVAWYVDSEESPFRPGDPLPVRQGNPYSWKSDEFPDGGHVIRARVGGAGNRYVEYSRAISTSNVGLALFVEAAQSDSSTGVIAYASAQVGIAKVESLVTGLPTQTLTLPNACTSFCISSGRSGYRFDYSSPTTPAGQYSALVRATDKAGNIKERTASFVVYNKPLLTLAQPTSGFVKGELRIAGSVAFDAPSIVVTALLGSDKVFETTASTFDTRIDVRNRGLGQRTLTVIAKDSSNQTTIAQKTLILLSEAAPVPEMVAAIDSDANIEAAGGDLLVVRRANNTRYAINHAAGWQSDLPQGAGLSTPYQIAGNAVFAWGQSALSPCPSTTQDICIYKWSGPSGGWENVSATDPTFTGVQNTRKWLSTKGRYALWLNESVLPYSFTLLDTQTGIHTHIPRMTSGYSFWIKFDFAVVGGHPIIFLWASPSTLNDPATALFRWTSATGWNQVVSLTGTEAGAAVKTDGVHVAYEIASFHSPSDATLPTYRTEVRPVAGGAATILTNDGSFPTMDLSLVDGVLSYSERSGDRPIRAWSPELGAVALSSSQAGLYWRSGSDVGAGVYAYHRIASDEPAGIYMWNGKTGVSKPLAEGVYGYRFIVGDKLYFKFDNKIYRVPLS